MTSQPQHVGLGAAFAPARGGVPDRSAGLAGILAPKPHTAPTAEPARSPNTPRAAQGAKHDPAGEIIVSVPIYLPPATLDKAGELCRARRTTYADLAIEAFTAVPQDNLIAYFATTPPVPNGRGIPVGHPRTRPGHGVQRQFRFLVETRNWIKDEAKTVKAPSVSALVAAVMGMHLGTIEGWSSAG